MNVQVTEHELSTMKFGMGQPVPRTEDPTLLTGQGQYTDDLHVEGQMYGYVVRSPYAHGVIKGIDTAAAKMPGVIAVYTAEGLDAVGYGSVPCVVPFKNRDGSEMHKPQRPGLCRDKVRYVGDSVAFVVAETYAQAKDAAEAVELDVDMLPAVTDPAEAAKNSAPQIYDGVANNVCLDFHFGDKEATDKAFAAAAHTVKLTLDNNRVVVAAMEPGRRSRNTPRPSASPFTPEARAPSVCGTRLPMRCSRSRRIRSA